MRSAIFAAARLVVAGIAVIGGVLTAMRIAEYTQKGGLISSPGWVGDVGKNVPLVQHPIPLSWYSPGAFYWVTPWWAYALAVAAGLLGVALAVLILRVPSRDVVRLSPG